MSFQAYKKIQTQISTAYHPCLFLPGALPPVSGPQFFPGTMLIFLPNNFHKLLFPPSVMPFIILHLGIYASLYDQRIVNVNKHVFICNVYRIFYRMTGMFYIDNEWFVGSDRLATPDLRIGNCIT